MLSIQNLTYNHPNKDTLFTKINFNVVKHEKVALIGNNGSGKSTLLKLIAGELEPVAGKILRDTSAYYVPQVFGQFNHLNVAQALKIQRKLIALQEILSGNVNNQNFSSLNDDWSIEQRSLDALKNWNLEGIRLDQKMDTLSGGQKTRVLLAGLSIHAPELILLDEPTNHLDIAGREALYHFVATSKQTLIIVSHDKQLLNLLEKVCELSEKGIKSFGGNYDFYYKRKMIEIEALHHEIHSNDRALQAAKLKHRKTLERHQKSQVRGRSKKIKDGVPKMDLNILKNSAEKSTSKLKSVFTEKIGGISKQLSDLRSQLSGTDKMKLNFEDSSSHKGKILFRANALNFSYAKNPLWKEELNFLIKSGDRINIQGGNGSGKTTLIHLILGSLKPTEGIVYRAKQRTIYIDQEFSLIQNDLSVYEQAQKFNTTVLQEHEIKIRLHRFLFQKNDWDKSCSVLSGGERMRLMLCCLNIQMQSPDIIVLDEPTNNLDIQNIDILASVFGEYKGTLIVISHDLTFLEELKIKRIISLKE